MEDLDADNVFVHVDKAWGNTCRILLGESIGNIENYQDYLKKFVTPYGLAKSAISNKEISISSDYQPGSRFISGDEIGEYAKLFEKNPLDINKIKDIDSIIEALAERFYYSGNDSLGNSAHIFQSNRVVDSHFVFKSHDVFYSKYIAYTYLSKFTEHAFGCESVGKGTHFAIKSYEIYEASRVLECIRVYLSTDCWYSANLENCQNCLFSFNLRSKRRCIGNLELNEDEFTKLKKKLQEDMRQGLEAHGSIISIVDLIGGGARE